MKWHYKVYILLLIACSCIHLNTTSLWEHLNKSLIKEDSAIAQCIYDSVFKVFPETVALRIRTLVTHNSNKGKFADIIDVLLSKNNHVLIDLASTDHLNYPVPVRLFFIDSIEALRTILMEERTRRFASPRYRYYMIVLPPKLQNHFHLLQQIVSFCWENHIINVNIVFEDEHGVITFYTYFPFSPDSCYNITPVVSKRFTDGICRVPRYSLFPEKDNNFWKCPIKAVTWSNPPFVLLDHSKQGKSERISGLDGEILKMLAAIFNFTLEIVHLPKGRGLIEDKSKTTGVVKILQENNATLAIGNLKCSYKLLNEISLSDNYYMSNIRVVLLTQSYSPLEALFIPFDIYTWNIIFLFIVGQKIFRMILKKIFGGRLPLQTNRFNTRMYMIIYLFSHFMIRTAYEGSLYNFLHNRPIKQLPQTLDEAIRDGYQFIVDRQTYSSIEPTAALNASLIVVNVSESDTLKQIIFYQGKIGVFVLDDYFSKYLKMNIKYETLRNYGLLKENIFSKLACIYLPKFSYLVQHLNKKLSLIKSHGLLNKFYKQFIDMERLRADEEKISKVVREKPRTLDLQQLMGALKIFCIWIGFSMIVFLLELASQKYRKLAAILKIFH